MKKYAIVRSKDEDNKYMWRSYRYNLMFRLSACSWHNCLTYSKESADHCEVRLIALLESKKCKPEVIRIVEL